MSKTTITILVAIIVVLGGGFIIYKNNSTASNQPTKITTPIQLPNAPTTKFTMTDVAQHDSRTSCYSAIRGIVYDLTSAISTHPGGPTAILSLCGKDGTQAFVDKHGGRPRQEQGLAKLQVGVLAQ